MRDFITRDFVMLADVSVKGDGDFFEA